MTPRDFHRFWKMLPGWAKVLVLLLYPVAKFFEWIWSWFGG